MPGFTAGLLMDPAQRTAAVSVANASFGGTPGLPSTLLDILTANEPALPPEWTPEPSLEGADELLGAWFWGDLPLTLSVREGQLTLAAAHRTSRFVAEDHDRWRGLDRYFAGEALLVVRDGASISHLELATYRLTRSPYGH